MTTDAEEAKADCFYENQHDLLELKPEKDILFITGDWNGKIESQEIPTITGKFGLGVKMVLDYK